MNNRNILNEALRDEVLEVVAQKTGIPIESILSRSKKHEILTARQIASYILARVYNLPLKTVGHCVGGYDHATVLNSIMIIEDYIFLKNRYEYEIIEEILGHFTNKKALILSA
ncbi:MAG TPA: hypothetical protein DCS19_01695 [Flavobacterium sp.]|nr:hypothetical protein [Flavobacterium sp.]